MGVPEASPHRRAFRPLPSLLSPLDRYGGDLRVRVGIHGEDHRYHRYDTIRTIRTIRTTFRLAPVVAPLQHAACGKPGKEPTNLNNWSIPVRRPRGPRRYLLRQTSLLVRRLGAAAEVGGNELADAPSAEAVTEGDPDGAFGLLWAVLEEVNLLDVKAS